MIRMGKSSGKSGFRYSTSCPAFGGADMKTLYVTTASSRFEPEDFKREPNAGALFAVDTDVVVCGTGIWRLIYAI